MDSRPVSEIKEEMAEVGRRIWQRGFCAGNEGNHSVRIGADRVLCTPTGMSKGFLSPDDMCLIDMDGAEVEPSARGRRPTSEVKIHLAIYRKRRDVAAVVHSHPPHAVAFAIAGIPPAEGVYPEAELFLGRVRIAPYATPSTQALPDSITPLIEPDTNSLLLANHGSVNFSGSLMDAYYKLEILDAYCRILLLCRQLGPVNTLTATQVAELRTLRQQYDLSIAPKEEQARGR